MAAITISDIVSATNNLDGSGSFDSLMRAVEARLEDQYRQGKIKGTDYSNVYLGAMQAVLQQSIAYTLGVQQADKQADLLAEQILETTARTSLVGQQLFTEQANILDTVDGNAVVGVIGKQKDLVTQQIAKLVKEEDLVDAQVFSEQAQRLDIVDGSAVEGVIGTKKLLTLAQVSKVNAETLLVAKQEDLIDEQILSQIAQRLDDVDGAPVTGILGSQIALNLAKISKIAKEEDLVDEQIFISTAQRLDLVDGAAVEGVIKLQKDKISQEILNLAKAEDLVDKQILTEEANTTNPTGGLTLSQFNKLAAEKTLLENKTATELAQTASNTVSDSVIGKQKELYAAQIAGFEKDAKVKAAKVATDMWTIARSTDDGAAASTVPIVASGVGSLNTTVAGLLTDAGLPIV